MIVIRLGLPLKEDSGLQTRKGRTIVERELEGNIEDLFESFSQQHLRAIVHLS